MNSTETPCRLAVFLAREAPIAVILRKGPHNWVEMIRWNTQHDRFEYGQWFKGRVYEHKCDLSPDGKLFLYFALKLNKRTLSKVEGYSYAWTALSQPPTFTALGLWTQTTTYGGGGLFEDNQTIWLTSLCNDQPHPNHLPPKSLKFISKPETNVFNTDLYATRLQSLGWQLVDQGSARNKFTTDIRPRLWQRIHPSKKYSLLMLENEYDFKKYGGPYSSEVFLRNEQSHQEQAMEGVTWADWDHNGRLVLAKDGQLYTDRSSNFNQLTMLADFNPDVPQITEDVPTKARRTSKKQEASKNKMNSKIKTILP